jgi:hypothetical protein
MVLLVFFQQELLLALTFLSYLLRTRRPRACLLLCASSDRRLLRKPPPLGRRSGRNHGPRAHPRLRRTYAAAAQEDPGGRILTVFLSGDDGSSLCGRWISQSLLCSRAGAVLEVGSTRDGWRADCLGIDAQ